MEKPQELLLSSFLPPPPASGLQDGDQCSQASDASTATPTNNVQMYVELEASYQRDSHSFVKEKSPSPIDEGILVMVNAAHGYNNARSVQPTVTRLDARFVEEVLKRSMPEQYED
jgi:hypothetical protein